MRNLLSINGAKVLSKVEQVEIKGGQPVPIRCTHEGYCPGELYCDRGICIDGLVPPVLPK